MQEETTYTAISPDGRTDFIYADTMAEAYTQARDEYGPGVLIREAYYGEWECASEELAKANGGCYYDAYGTHHTIERKN